MTEEEQIRKRRNNKITGVILILLGVTGLSLRFIFNNSDEWRTVDILKVAVSIFMIGYGVYTIYRNRG